MNMHNRKIGAHTAASIAQIGVVKPVKDLSSAFRQHAEAMAAYEAASIPEELEDDFGMAREVVDQALYNRVQERTIRSKADAVAALAWLIHEHSEFQFAHYPDKVGETYDADDAKAKLLADISTFIASMPEPPKALPPEVPRLAADWFVKTSELNACEWTDGCPEEKAWQEAERAMVETPSTGLADLIAKARVVNAAFTGSENLGVIDPLAHSIIADLLRLGGERNVPVWKNPA